MYRDGMGGWLTTQRDQQKINPDFDVQPLPVFSATGGKPMMWVNEKPVFYTFLKKGLSKDRMHEILSVLNWCAAPFGSFEFEFNQYGVEGKHFTRAADNSPIQTDLGRKELVGQYSIMSGRVPVTVGTSEVPNYVPDSMAYAQQTVKYLEESPFSGIKLEYPPAYSKLIVSTEERFKDVVRGRRPVSDVDAIVTEWRRAGGDVGRACFEKALAANGR
jgi:putative aldouronate transport system substrate-binding protein